MAERLKVFKNSAGVTTTDLDILTTTATTQAVVKELELVLRPDTNYDTKYVVSEGSHTYYETTLSPSDAEEEVKGSGQSMIVDVSSSLTVAKSISSHDQYYLNNAEALVFYSDSDSELIQIDHTNNISGRAFTFDTDLKSLTTRSGVTGVLHTLNAWSSCALEIGGVPYFFRAYNSELFKYDIDGVQVGATLAIGNYGYGVCTDGVKVYSPLDGSSVIKVINPDTMVLEADLVTTGGTVGVAGGNAGSFTVIHEGFMYSKATAGNDYISKINLSTGVLVIISDANFAVGSYSSGARVTIAPNGVPYIIEHGHSQAMAFNLITQEVQNITTTLSQSTEYSQGRCMELAAGLVFFASYTTAGIILAIGKDGVLKEQDKLSTPNNSNLPNGRNYLSIAQIPLHLNYGAAVPADSTYDVYASGVEITGV